MPSGSGAMCAEYFSSATWTAGIRAANVGLAMCSSPNGRKPRRPERTLGLHDDARRRLAANVDVQLRLEADAREPEPAARRRGLLLHGPEVVSERVRLRVGLLGTVVHDADPDAVGLLVHLEIELDLLPARVRHRVLHELVHGQRDLRLAIGPERGARAERLHEASDLVDEDPGRVHPDEELDRRASAPRILRLDHSCASGRPPSCRQPVRVRTAAPRRTPSRGPATPTGGPPSRAAPARAPRRTWPARRPSPRGCRRSRSRPSRPARAGTRTPRSPAARRPP